MDHNVHEPPRHAAVLGGRYQLGALLGRGGMSEVYRAQDQVMQREVAVKVLRANGSDDTMARRMSQEARIVAAVDHPHLVRVHDAGCEDGQCYLVMELVDGGTLGDLVERGPMPAELAARIGTQLAQALGAIHAAGFVHRDIKPANVLLARPAEVADDVSARLTDFGIARMVDGTRLTSTGLMLGTAPYLSPEQVMGTLVSYPSDVYALGLLLLECRTAAQAYPGPAVESAVARLHRQPDVPASLGPAWVALLTAMTARDPAGRPTAEQVAASLSDLAEGRAPAGNGALLAGTSNSEPVGDSPPARRGLVARAAGGTGRDSPGHHPRGTHATHPISHGSEGEDAARHPLRGARRLVGAAAAAAAVFTAAALVSGSSSPFRTERPQASQPAHHGTTTTSGTTSPSLPKSKSPGKRTAGPGPAELAGTVAGGSASVEQAARTAVRGVGAVLAPGRAGSTASPAASTDHGTGASVRTRSSGTGGSTSTGSTGTGSTVTGSPTKSSSAKGPDNGNGNGTGRANGHGHSNGNGRGNGNGASHSATGNGPGGTTAAPPTSATSPASSSAPTSASIPPSSSDPSSSPTDSPTSTPDPAASSSDPGPNPLASQSSSSSTTRDATIGDATTSDATTSDLGGSPAGPLP